MHLTDLLSDDRPVRPAAPPHPGPRPRHGRGADRRGRAAYDRARRPPRQALALVPFRQIRERGFDVRDDGTPLPSCTPRSHELPLDEALAALPAHDVRVEGGAFDVDDEAYADIVGRVLRDEIGRGEGANFVIRRTYEGADPGLRQGRRAGALPPAAGRASGARTGRTSCTPGERTLVGASPEVHVRMSGGTVVMNPISGTYRYPAEGPTADDLLAFLADRKEIEELSMVVDEELKMMCTVGDMGGVVVGPRLKEMAHLAHTEYELRGRSSLDVREVLKETMFAATVTGSPVQNACRVIERHEAGGRGYYAGALALHRPRRRRRADPGLPHPDPYRRHRRGRRGCGSRSAPRWCAAPTRRARSPRRTRRRRGCSPRSGVRPGRPRRRRTHAPAAGRRPPGAGGAGRRGGPPWRRSGCGCRSGRGELAGHALVVDGEDTFTAMLAHCCARSGLDGDRAALRRAGAAGGGARAQGPGRAGPRARRPVRRRRPEDALPARR